MQIMSTNHVSAVKLHTELYYDSPVKFFGEEADTSIT